MSNLLAAVSRVPPRSVILYLTLFRDAAGQTLVPHDVASRISAVARAPVYIFVDQFLSLVRSSPHHGTTLEVSVPVAIANNAGTVAV